MATTDIQPELYKLIKTEQAAEFLGISKRKLEFMRDEVDGPGYIRLGRAVRYRLADLIAFQEQQVRHSGDENQA